MDTITITLTGNPSNSYFRLRPIHARRLGLEPHPEMEYALVLMEDADPQARLVLPNGVDFTAEELTQLASKDGDPRGGWWIDSNDSGGFPSWELDVPDAATA